MLGVDEGRDAALFLRLGDGMDGQRGLTRRLRAIDFYHSAAGIAANAQGHVEPDGARGDDIHILHLLVAHPHDGAFTEIFLYLAHSGLEGLHLGLFLRLFLLGFLSCELFFCFCHYL